MTNKVKATSKMPMGKGMLTGKGKGMKGSLSATRKGPAKNGCAGG